MIRSRPTSYNGIQFRSRLEAHWAEYFDFCGWIWSFEPEGFLLGNGATYLPDFYLSSLDLFVECRGTLERSMRKTALFLKESRRPVLVALPQGRFFLAADEDAETGESTRVFWEAMFDGDRARIEEFQSSISCFCEVEEDAVGGPSRFFANTGFSSPDYCGYAPDWYNSMKDRSRSDGGDARTHYYGGMSTWEQRGFQRKNAVFTHVS